MPYPPPLPRGNGAVLVVVVVA
eukprot:COSAG01_NODE_45774_length_406_cov_1.065147_1_plen_21_part_01